MKFLLYTVEDFAEDECFIKWVKDPNPETDFFWTSFLAEFPEKRKLIEQARILVEEVSIDHSDISYEEINELRVSISSAISEIEKSKTIPLSPAKTIGFRLVLKVAAVTIGIILITVFVSNIILNKQPLDTISLEERVNPNGQRSSLMLPDGSKVWLNAGSKLKYYSNLNDRKTREVFLDGEAFFEVSKNKKKPFIVRTNSLAIKVLGTAFNVKSYPEEKTVETTLVEGAVAINEKSDNVLLKPSQQAVFSKQEKKIRLFDVDPTIATSWKDGKLVFEDERFEDVIQKLERWYGVDLEVNEGKSCRINFKIGKESLKEVLENIKIATNLQYKLIGNKTVIDIKDCK
jgi:transmembrane sensor